MFDEFIQPINLIEDSSIYENQTLEQSLIGWRAVPSISGEKALFWRDEPIKYKSTEVCRQNYAALLAPHGISNEMFCRGGETAGTSCGWEFGAPLVIKDGAAADGGELVKVAATQLGIYSWGVEALLPECKFSEENPAPLVFTRVASFYKWILTNLIH